MGVSGSSPSAKGNELESEVNDILKEIDAPIEPDLVGNCHRLFSKDHIEIEPL